MTTDVPTGPTTDLENTSLVGLRIRAERRRYGKTVTIIEGVPLARLDELARILKRRLATGGAIKDQAIELQGDQAARATALLRSLGHDIAP